MALHGIAEAAFRSQWRSLSFIVLVQIIVFCRKLIRQYCRQHSSRFTLHD